MMHFFIENTAVLKDTLKRIINKAKKIGCKKYNMR